jgi:GTP-binding protein EngB required for normal cell division
MENGLGEFVIKFLKDKTETRKIIKCDDFFQLLNDMGLNDDNDEVVNIIDYLDNNNTDINFHGAKTHNFYNRFRNIEKKIQMSKILNGTKTEVQKLIEKVDKIKVQERPDWLEMYRDDSTDEKIEESKMKVSNENPYQRITNMLMEELKEQVENEPEVTIEGIQEEIENKITYQENPIMGQMSGEELRDFLSNRIIPERFRENNNNN